MINKITHSDADKARLAELEVDPAEIVDDHFDYSKVVVKKPWGYEYLIYQNKDVAVWILYLRPGAQTSMHCHPGKKTSLVVLEGQVRCATLSDQFVKNAGEGMLIGKSVFHETTAMSEQGAFVMEIETPVNKRDLIRLRDKYGREGKGYESAQQHSVNTQNYNYLSLSSREAEYNLKKRFGQCTLTLKKVRTAEDLKDLKDLTDHDIISMIAGKSGTSIEVGDTVAARDFKKMAALKPQGELEFLIIKKMDLVIKVTDFVVEFIKKQGVKEVFCAPGDANVHLLDSIGRAEQLRFVCHQMERGASLAAEAYSKLTGDLGVLVISSGASGINALPGVSNAWIDSVPLLVISGQARTDQDFDGQVRQLGNKSLNITDIAKPITKYCVKVTDPATIQYHLEKAVRLARSGRPGPVWIDLPIDIQGMTVDAKDLKPYDGEITSARSGPTFAPQIKELLKQLGKAKRPVVLAGNGIRLSGAHAEFLQMVDYLGVPVLTSRRGADLMSEDHPLFYGRPGVYGQRRANFIVQNADFLLTIGTRLSIPLTGRNTEAFARDAYKVIVDIDPNELKKDTVHPDLPIPLSAREFVSELTRALEKSSYSAGQYAEWIKRCDQWQKDFPLLAEQYDKGPGINPYVLTSELSAALSEDDVIVVDGGPAMMYVMQTFAFKKGQRMVSSTGLELHGFSLSGVIGASLARGSKRVFCLCEDLGFQISMPELQTIAENRLPVVIFILNSKGHSNIRKIQKDFFGARYVGTDQNLMPGATPIAEVAKVFGFEIIKIKDTAGIKKGLQEALKAKGPMICEIDVNTDQEFIPRVSLVVKDDGKWFAKPLEDMYPYLDKKTLKQNMLIDLLEEE